MPLHAQILKNPIYCDLTYSKYTIVPTFHSAGGAKPGAAAAEKKPTVETVDSDDDMPPLEEVFFPLFSFFFFNFIWCLLLVC
jgi:hypothetical protein